MFAKKALSIGHVLTPKYGMRQMKPMKLQDHSAYIMTRAVEDFVLKHPVKTNGTKEPAAKPSETESQPL